jgi:hypothetical protein
VVWWQSGPYWHTGRKLAPAQAASESRGRRAAWQGRARTHKRDSEHWQRAAATRVPRAHPHLTVTVTGRGPGAASVPATEWPMPMAGGAVARR